MKFIARMAREKGDFATAMKPTIFGGVGIDRGDIEKERSFRKRKKVMRKGGNVMRTENVFRIDSKKGEKSNERVSCNVYFLYFQVKKTFLTIDAYHNYMAILSNTYRWLRQNTRSVIFVGKASGRLPLFFIKLYR